MIITNRFKSRVDERLIGCDCDEVFDALAIADRSAKLAAGGND
ncbi:MAG: hypothetical protein ACI4JV_00850 [Ruminiclostridium sp.]